MLRKNKLNTKRNKKWKKVKYQKNKMRMNY